ncbi:hypothetical protein ABC977_01010 [Thioalkalicoccus limnaeus]|uniref:Uncharacterized protein n=1 Tax=Thioalkalicoccus limnaeus TaxID=120681 RepID=A0ABV4B9F1_9GAMM
MTRTLSIALVLLVSGFLTGVGPPSASAQTGREAMADAMSRMMEAMGAFGNIPAPDPNLMTPPRMDESMGHGLRPFLEPFDGSLSDLGEIVGQGTGRPFEGLWESPTGGLLIVQGRFYRLYEPGAGYVEGTLSHDDRQVRMRNRHEGFEHRFDYALHDDGIALRGEGGQIFVYRRLRLDRDRLR